MNGPHMDPLGEWPRASVQLAIAILCGLGCARPEGTVELNWVFVDRGGTAIFPAGQFSPGADVCGRPGRVRGIPRNYDLGVQLDICDETCPGGCEDPQCLVMPSERFGCDTARATLSDVPASPDPYLFIVRGVLTTADRTCVDPPPTCLAVPGPRERTVEGGRVVDLQVYQIPVNIDVNRDDTLDLEACRCG